MKAFMQTFISGACVYLCVLCYYQNGQLDRCVNIIKRYEALTDTMNSHADHCFNAYMNVAKQYKDHLRNDLNIK